MGKTTTNIIEPITVNGGTIKMTGQSGFDFDGTAIYTCGEIYLNGEKQTEIVNSFINQFLNFLYPFKLSNTFEKFYSSFEMFIG